MAKKSPAKPRKTKKKAAKKAPTRKLEYTAAGNRILRAVAGRTGKTRRLFADALKAQDVRPVELAPAFKLLHDENPTRAGRLAEAYAVTLDDQLQHREFFQGVARLDQPQRVAAVRAYQNAGQAKGVVQAISLLPRAQGRTIMRDFIYKDADEVDQSSLRDVLHWLRDAGRTMREIDHAGGALDPELDGAIVDIFEDIGDAISDAVTAVVDAVVDAVEALAPWKPATNWSRRWSRV